MADYYEEGPRGVGGWLGLFVFAIAIASPARLLISGYQNLYGDPAVRTAYGAAWPALEIGEWVLLVLSVAGCWFVTWRLFNAYRWSTVRIAIAGIWMLAFGVPFIELTMVSFIAGLPMLSVADGMAAELGQPAAFCVIWTLYFLNSRRVSNTYLRHEEEEVSEVFQ